MDITITGKIDGYLTDEEQCMLMDTLAQLGIAEVEIKEGDEDE